MKKQKQNYVRFNGWLKPSHVKKLKKVSKQENISMSEVLRILIDNSIV